MKRLPFIILLFAVGLFGQIKKPGGEIIIDPVKPPVEIAKAQLIIEHQNVTINKVDYQDVKLIYECNPIIIKNCTKAKLITRVDAIKTTAGKLTVEYKDPRLGKMSQVFFGAMPSVEEISVVQQIEP